MSVKKHLILIAVFLLSGVIIYGLTYKDIIKNFRYRNLGPFRTGSWISCIAVPPMDKPGYKYTYYIGARNGGVWKTINSGTTFVPVFDNQKSLSIGDIAIDPLNPEVIWVGTGESFNARLSHPGDGIYRSEDGGKTWKHMGLSDSQHIAKIVIDPRNTKNIYVAVMGHLFSPNKMRGVYKSTDSGKTWERVLYIGPDAGVIDLKINPKNPRILYAASYEKYRYPWHFEAGGEKSGIYRTKNGGKSWHKLKSGLPNGKLGRIGIDIFNPDPDILFAVIENLNPRPGIKKKIENKTFNKMKDPYFDTLIGGEIYKSQDGGDNWKKMNGKKDNVSSKAAYSFNKVSVDQKNSSHILVTGINMSSSFDSGKTWVDLKWPPKKFFLNMFGDVRTFWIDPNDPEHMMIGSDGGLYVSYDGGKTVDHLYNIPLGEAYTIETDSVEPYNIYIGLQDHEVWKGPSNGWSGRITIEDWTLAGKWDGMFFSVDQTNNRFGYTTTQFGGHLRVDMLKGSRKDIEPKTEKGNKPYRFPWTPVIIVSKHNPQLLFAGSQYLLMSPDRGDHWTEISKDLTTNNDRKIAGKGHMMYCTITTISESPVEAGLIWTGTDDGNVHLTKGYGKSTSDLTKNLSDAGCPGNYWTTSVFASHHNSKKAYLSKSGFKFDDFTPLIYMTDDSGKSWHKITEGLPEAPVNCIVEDKINPDLLFAGTDKGIYVSFSAGKEWIPFNNNIPQVPVKDIKIQDRENDLVVATYGRGAWVTDILPLRYLTKKSLNHYAYLFPIEPKPQINHSPRAYWGNYTLSGDRPVITPNEKNGTIIYYLVTKLLKSHPFLTIKNIYGKELISFSLIKDPGLHSLTWERAGIKPGIYIAIFKLGKLTMKRKIIVKKRFDWTVGRISLKGE